MSAKLEVGLSGDFLRLDGSPVYPEFDLRPLLSRSDIALSYLKDTSVIGDDQAERFDALIISGPAVSAKSFHPNSRLAVIALFGVGYDKVDTSACNENAVAFTITPDGVQRPVAVSILTLILALTGRLLEKERIAREGEPGWARAADFHGIGLVGKVLGSIGLGNIGAEMFRITAPLGMRPIAYDPYADPKVAVELGVRLVDLDTVIRESDVLAVNCPLTPSTRHLLNRDRLALMKPTAFLINTARGGIIDQAALVDTLRNRKIAGAGLDVLETEPPNSSDPILSLDNALLTPHALCWTDQLFAGCAANDVQAVLDVFDGKVPRGLVNREIAGDARWQAKLNHFAARKAGL